MDNIKLNDMDNTQEQEVVLSADVAEAVKGGPLTGYLKIPDIDGESQVTRATSESFSFNYEKIRR